MNMNEELMGRMYRDDLIDRGFFFGKLPVREFARMMRTAPQLVYYRVRTGKLKLYQCSECGREGLVDVREGLSAFRTAPEDVQEAEKAHREDLDAGASED